ncbi:MAG: GNAT family N-acetyltransferase [Candidatus Omnitrophica bacterium]|nr:GNAT family N-acetyltransferase [Candidatus Omnitrophota bacterium]MBU1808965.1 GNAT family N-acetyltransferase [Candidatus Omnitrophota bacterium]
MKQYFDKEFLKTIVSDNPYGRYIEDNDIPRSLSIPYEIDCINHAINSADINMISFINTSGDIEGFIAVRISCWDTQHFEKKTAIIDYIRIISGSADHKIRIMNALLKMFKDWCGENKIEFVMAKISSWDLFVINALERFGFSFLESWIYNKYDLKKNIPDNEPLFKLRLANSSDIDHMLKYSNNAFVTQRIHADNNITHEKAESFYHKWIRTSFEDKSKKVLVYDRNGNPAAFMVYFIKDLKEKLNLKFAMWKMALIDPDIRGKGIGLSFFKSLLGYHKNEGLDVVDSGLSLRNAASLNLHNKADFKVISTLVSLHLWVKN